MTFSDRRHLPRPGIIACSHGEGIYMYGGYRCAKHPTAPTNQGRQGRARRQILEYLFDIMTQSAWSAGQTDLFRK